ncbi:hypothetical protein DICPUDRAFT_146755 [Dictyostelium purpureum]|uniref:Uncharacterized protein n=1 Tax=Dictyostelium purpureum TaxID=5786 RepID=F0Z6N4_DICPU|nr:uncharacterized protein DICPUDRAFT_146755 [Dictyostelium purpureum]EGC40342.1 hypothetical protein DICPUDRAFT_146755 [Dictyostelium purpureum]|eukprot:XP_003283093.1 hypothetical protein DICPUDRAFT_146755 [Dictyostelium purpureum]
MTHSNFAHITYRESYLTHFLQELYYYRANGSELVSESIVVSGWLYCPRDLFQTIGHIKML